MYTYKYIHEYNQVHGREGPGGGPLNKSYGSDKVGSQKASDAAAKVIIAVSVSYLFNLIVLFVAFFLPMPFLGGLYFIYGAYFSSFLL
jgi:hypothetical protein